MQQHNNFQHFAIFQSFFSKLKGHCEIINRSQQQCSSSKQLGKQEQWKIFDVTYSNIFDLWKLFQEDMSPTIVRLHSNGYILDHPSNNIYNGLVSTTQRLSSNFIDGNYFSPPPPASGCVYSTLPRPLPGSQCYTFQEDLTRQRSLANIGKNNIFFSYYSFSPWFDHGW